MKRLKGTLFVVSATCVAALAACSSGGEDKPSEYIPEWAGGTSSAAATPAAATTPKALTEYERWQEAFRPYSSDGSADRQAYEYHLSACKTLRDGGTQSTPVWPSKPPAQFLREEWGVGADSPSSTMQEKASAMENAIIPVLCPEQAHYLEEAKQGNFTPVQRTGFGNGKYLVGDDIQPGTYTTTGRVSECYWERSDSQGNIIANNFVSIAPSITVTVDAGDAGFTSQGCGMWKLDGS